MKFIRVPYIDQTAGGAYTGCESASACMLLNYLGIPMTLDSFIEDWLPAEPFEIKNGELYGPDPRVVFAGDPRDPEAMGCYAPVIRHTLSRILGDSWEVKDLTGSALESLTEYLYRDIPVLVWATIDMKEMIPGPEWKLKNSGDVFQWRSNEHCLLLVGCDEECYYFNDPWQNNGVVKHPKELAEIRYASQYSQAVAAVRKSEI